MSADDYDTTIIDRAALDLASELEKAAICDVVANLVNQEVAVINPQDFWNAVSTALMIRNFNRSGAEVKYLFDKCFKEGRKVVDARRYIQSKTRAVGDYPASVPDYAAPGFVNEEQKKKLESTAAAALALMEESEGMGEEMSFRGK